MLRFRVLLSAVVLFSFCRLVAAQTIEVNEKASRLRLRDGAGSRLELRVKNSLAETLQARLQLEILDPHGRLQGQAEQQAPIGPGEHTITISFPFWDKLSDNQLDEIVWYRLQYKLDAANIAAPPLSGIVAVSEITPQLFQLKVASPRELSDGVSSPIHVHTQHPVTLKPVGGVLVQAKLELGDGNDTVLHAKSVTDGNGNATMIFAIPRGRLSDSSDLTVTAANASLRREVSQSLEPANATAAMITTDKPIYQPGQIVHMRALLISKLKRVQANTAVTVTIADPENTTVFHESLKSSRFGIVHADWQIPENQRLGDYTLEVAPENGDDSRWRASQRVKISRYELPNFVVNVKPDKSYYLPGQNARVEVHGDYLFGKPVTHGHVRLVREEDRQWNFKEQKWEVEEGQTYEGELDANGAFVAQVNLKDEEDDLPENDNYARFKDLQFAAYVTDSTTRRTEQRRFDLRITRNAIHVYFRPDSPSDQELPLTFYLIAQYADGTPCECDITINKSSIRRTGDGESTELSEVHTVRSTRYGLAKVAGMAWPQFEADEHEPGLEFEAHDAKGASGKHTEILRSWRGDAVYLTTDKAVYADGDPIQLKIQSSSKDASLIVEVRSQSNLVTNESVTLSKGKAWLTVPYSPQLQDEVTIVAYDMARLSNYYYYSNDSGFAFRTVLYPRKHDLGLKVRLEKASFRPGEQVQADFNVSAPNGGVVESALALAITDAAVAARARTEQDFNSGGNYWGGYGGYWFNSTSIAGFTRADLDSIDTAKSVPADLDMLAEAILAWDERGPYGEVESSGDMSGAWGIFRDSIQADLHLVISALNERYQKQEEYPRDEETLRRLLREAGIERNEIRDPWGVPYRVRFTTERELDKMVFVSAGPDKTFGTHDDFEGESLSWPYFRPYGRAIDKAVEKHHQRTGKFIRDAATLKSELRAQGIDWEQLKDRWGSPYVLDFGVAGRFYTIGVSSGGPDKTYQSGQRYDPDDFKLWNSRIDYLGELEAKVSNAIADYFRKTLIFPEKESDLQAALSAVGLDLKSEKMLDPWGTPYYPVFNQSSIYSDRVAVEARAAANETRTKPVTVRLKTVSLHSCGPNKVKGDYGDFELAQFSTLVSEQSASDAVPQPAKELIVFTGHTGAIAGTVTDMTEAAIPKAMVVAVSDGNSNLTFTATSNDSGQYLLLDLPADSYTVRCQFAGFQTAQITHVHVLAKNITQINIRLTVAAATQTVEVTAEAPQTQTMSSMSATVAKVENLPLLGRNILQLAKLAPAVMAPPSSTPRLREYFPETLLWEPELITDKRGRSRLKFTLADNITSWKIAVLASDAKGEIGSAEKEFTAFQPFFADLDPPPVLTQNDEISLPLVLRNYLEKPQQVQVDMKTEPWFVLLGAASQRADVPAGDSKNAIFPFRAIAAVHEGKQRVTAIAGDASDAIERKVNVHPDGEEQVVSQGQIFSSHADFKAAVPENAIAGSLHAELKIYPNLMAHVMESIEGSLERPYGCGEQTISSTYPNLLVLRAYKAQGLNGPNAAQASRYLTQGYNRLLSYRSSEGGFTYWGTGEPDFALTAYAIQFLNDAKEFIDVDDGIISTAQRWLLQQQTKDGDWRPNSRFVNSDYEAWHKLSTSSYVTRVLAVTLTDEERKRPPSATSLSGHLHTALNYLAKRIEENDEPYFIVNYTLAAAALGDDAAAARGRQRLKSLVHETDGEAYWELQRNTPFYGWGVPGRVETTALVLRALSQGNDRPESLLLSGLRFLLHSKDRYGVWYSGQATVNVLKTLIDMTDAAGAMTKGENPTEIKVNGKTVKSVVIPAGKEIVNPTTIDLSELLSPGGNQVELAGASEAARSSAQLVTTYYVPWQAAEAGKAADEKPGDSDILHLAVHYDKTEARIGDEIHCHVEVERIGFRGYGMMLAEIGLPPGADVDRESLDKAIANAGWSLNHYDVLPDRLIAYVWPAWRGGPTRFEFTFHPRMGEVAQTAPSQLYDYYNPEARAVVAPTKFVVH